MRLFMLLILPCLSTTALAQVSTAFTYQGELQESAVPADGFYDFEFALYTESSGGTPVAGPTAIGDVEVIDGLFSVEIDFGPGAFGVVDQWLEIRVRNAADGGFGGARGSLENYTVLTPRQLITPAPIALNAQTVEVGAVGSAEIADGSVGAVDADLDQLQARVASACPNGWAMRRIFADGSLDCEITGGDPANFWAVQGNAGTSAATDFIGTTDDVWFDVRINDRRAMRYEWGFAASGAPNLIGGAETNSIPDTVEASVIAGGGLLAAPNQISASYSAIGGGIGNSISGAWSAIPGGRSNTVTGSDSVAMGRSASALHDRSFVWNDGGSFESTANEQFLISADGGVGIGTNSPSDALHVNALSGADALRIQTDGVTRLRVHANGGVSVGAFTTPPAEGLLVRGEIEYQTSRTRWYNIGSSQLLPNDATDVDFIKRTTAGFEIVKDSLCGPFFRNYSAQVHLPHGAVVTQLSNRLTDNDTTGVTITLERMDRNGFREVMASTVSTGQSTSPRTFSDNSIAFEDVDNQEYSYRVATNSRCEHGPFTIHSIRIAYQVAGPL